MFSPGIEPGTFCMIDRCDNHYTTNTSCAYGWLKKDNIKFNFNYASLYAKAQK